ncbi:hypothetical protein M436DRAFT_55047, partial [Aureobasidium namibiae CBS 147.97]
KRTAAGIPTWSPTVVLICRSTAYVWQSGRDAQFSADCGRTCNQLCSLRIYHSTNYWRLTEGVDPLRYPTLEADLKAKLVAQRTLSATRTSHSALKSFELNLGLYSRQDCRSSRQLNPRTEFSLRESYTS